MSANTTPWEVRTVYAGFTTRIAGYDVQRVHNPYTHQARVEYLERGKVFRTEQQAREAIAKAEGTE